MVASVAVGSDGTYLFTGVSNAAYQLQLTINRGVPGEAMPVTKLPAGLLYSGESLGEGTDGTPDGLLSVVVEGNADVTGANFGIVRLPDLTVNVTSTPNIMVGGTSFSVFIKVSELNKVASNGQIKVIVPRDSRWTLEGAFNAGLTQLDNTALNNPDWTMDTTNANYYILSTDAGIPAGGAHTVGFKAVFNPGQAMGIYSLTSQILPGSGSEVNKANNSDSERINYFNK